MVWKYAYFRKSVKTYFRGSKSKISKKKIAKIEKNGASHLRCTKIKRNGKTINIINVLVGMLEKS